MTTVHQIFTVRSFKSSRDRDFLKSLQIYDANTHPQTKTDSREIAYWLDANQSRVDAKFYVCGLYISTELVGYVEFIYLKKERVIHFDYFIIQTERRTAGVFHTFAEQMRAFFDEEKLAWDFITAEISHLDDSHGASRFAQRLIRLFRQVGFYEVLAEYKQPLLGLEYGDTAMEATLVLLPHVEMKTISRSRFIELVSAIYKKHYGEWYSIYPETRILYQKHINDLLDDLKKSLADKNEIQLRGPEKEFAEGNVKNDPPLQEALFYVAKILASAIAVAVFNILLRHKIESSPAWILGISVCVFVLLVITVSLTDKKRFEAFKLLISLVSKFFDR